MMTNAEPQLAPPGAGLPAVELQIGRILVAWRRWTGSRATNNVRFEQERKIIADLARSCDETAAARRVLIERPRGLEDSSRYWSVWMTLDHLRIVNSQIAQLIPSLVRGIVPPGKASTAKVKPSPAVTAAVVAEYEASCDAVLKAATDAPILKTQARFDHPWFGPLDAYGWHSMAASHMSIHRVQIERILAGLSESRGVPVAATAS